MLRRWPLQAPAPALPSMPKLRPVEIQPTLALSPTVHLGVRGSAPNVNGIKYEATTPVSTFLVGNLVGKCHFVGGDAAPKAATFGGDVALVTF